MSSGEGSGQQGQNSGSGPQQGNGGDMTGGQQQGQGAQQGQNVTQQQQLQLQQAASAQNNQSAQNQMQQLQVIQQPMQNQTYVQQLYNPSQGQLIMPGNISFNPQLNPQIQVITGKSFQQNQLGSPHMLTTATAGYTTIPTSAANLSNNQAYILNLMTSQPSILQQHQQQGKPGEMQKVIQPQITQTQLPQGLSWASPHAFLQNPIFIRGPNDQMFIHQQPQQQQPLLNNAGSHQQFTMPLTATGQLPTSISSISSGSANGLQQVNQQQQQNQTQVTQGNQTQVQQNQSQNPQPIQPANVLSMKSPANLQPKPPLQIQPSPTNQQAQHHHQQQQLQQQQMQNVTMSAMGGQQFQMIQQPSSQSNVINQQLITQQNQQSITTQVMHSTQQQQQQMQQPRQLTILPQQTSGQSLQPQQVTFIQQQQHQPIRPNYTVTATHGNSQPQGVTTTPVPQQRPKIRKPGVGRGTANNATSSTQQNKVMYPRSNMSNSVAPTQIQSKIAQTSQSPAGATITRVSVSNSMPQLQQPIQQPLKTINMSALHTPPSLPDATLTPLIPQSNSQITATPVQPPPQPLQMFATTPQQLPTPNISITPAPPPKKEEAVVESSVEHRGETEKENTKISNTSQSTEDIEDNKSKLPKAMVKPQVLTHIIEGFVIQEASEPFPMTKNGECEEPPKKKIALSGEMGKCEMCGKIDLKAKFKKNKRFCSSACAKEMKAQQHHINQQVANASISMNTIDNHKTKSKSKKWGESGESTDETSSSMGDTSVVSPMPVTIEHTEEEQKTNPNYQKWNVAEVVDFVRTIPGCSEYADEFAVQEIDGQALLLLKEDHLMSIGMKLGPALKLCAKIEALRTACNSGGSEQSAGKA